MFRLRIEKLIKVKLNVTVYQGRLIEQNLKRLLQSHLNLEIPEYKQKIIDHFFQI